MTKPTRRSRLVARFRRLRRAQFAVALLLFYLFVTGFQTARLDRLTAEAARDLAAAEETLAVMERAASAAALNDATDAQHERARERVEALGRSCETMRARCHGFSNTVGIAARVLGVRCRTTCGDDAATE